jgi:hypothetical protein
VEESGCVLIWGTLHEFTWRDWGKPRWTQDSPEYKAGVLTTGPGRSVGNWYINGEREGMPLKRPFSWYPWPELDSNRRVTRLKRRRIKSIIVRMLVPYWIATRSSVSSNHGFTFDLPPMARSILEPPPPQVIIPDDGSCGSFRNFGKPAIFYMTYFRNMNLHIFSINLHSLLAYPRSCSGMVVDELFVRRQQYKNILS